MVLIGRETGTADGHGLTSGVLHSTLRAPAKPCSLRSRLLRTRVMGSAWVDGREGVVVVGVGDGVRWSEQTNAGGQGKKGSPQPRPERARRPKSLARLWPSKRLSSSTAD